MKIGSLSYSMFTANSWSLYKRDQMKKYIAFQSFSKCRGWGSYLIHPGKFFKLQSHSSNLQISQITHIPGLDSDTVKCNGECKLVVRSKQSRDTKQFCKVLSTHNQISFFIVKFMKKQNTIQLCSQELSFQPKYSINPVAGTGQNTASLIPELSTGVLQIQVGQTFSWLLSPEMQRAAQKHKLLLHEGRKTFKVWALRSPFMNCRIKLLSFLQL